MKRGTRATAVIAAGLMALSMTACGAPATSNRSAELHRGLYAAEGGRLYRYPATGDNKGNVKQDVTDLVDDTRRAADDIGDDMKKAGQDIEHDLKNSTDKADHSSGSQRDKTTNAPGAAEYATSSAGVSLNGVQ